MRCAACEHENAPGLKFCGECGAKLASICDACGASNLPTQKFCGECGHRLGSSNKASAPEDPPTRISNDETSRLQDGAPETSPLAQGERRFATVVFSDLAGYTALNERLDPEEVESLVSRFKAEAARIVEAHGGIVNQFVGDEILALFGVPMAQENDPVQAVSATLALHAMARAISDQVEARVGQSLRLHSGIASGLLVARSRDRRDGTYGVTGDTVNTAARLVGQAAVDEIVVSPETQRLVRDYFQTEALPAVMLKGKTEPVHPYRIGVKTAIATRWEAARLRGLTRYAGREEELAMLRKAAERTVEGQGQFATVMGEAGIGKSRLLFEFRHALDATPLEVLEGRCRAQGRDIPYAPFVDALRHALGLDEHADGSPQHDRAVEAISALSSDLQAFVPHVLYLIAIPSEVYVLPAQLQGGELKLALQESVSTFFTTLALRRPLLLILEDWHWADAASQDTLKALVSLVPRYPLMIVNTFRPDQPHAWIPAEHYTPIVMKPLDAGNVASMACALIGAQRLPSGLAQQLQLRCAGNALFSEEMIRSLIEEGVIVLREGEALLQLPLEAVHLPATVQAVIRARVDRLDTDAREVLGLASVIGREFGRRILEGLFPATDRMHAALERVQRLDLIQPVRVGSDASWIFKHVLVQEVVYETLLLERRRAIHGQVGGLIESIYESNVEAHFESLARHFSHSTHTAKAVEYLEKSGDKAAGFFALPEARRYYEQAIALLDRSTLEAKDKRRYVLLAGKWADGSFYSTSTRNLTALQRALKFAQDLGDATLEDKCHFHIASVHYCLGDMHAANAAFDAFEQRMRSNPDSVLLARARIVYGIVQLYFGQYRDGIVVLNKALRVLESNTMSAEVSWANGMLGNLHGWLGEFSTSREYTDKAYAQAVALNNKTRQAMTRVYSAVHLMMQGHLSEALVEADEAIQWGERIQNSVTAAFGYALRARTRALQSPLGGVQDARRAIALVQEAGTTLGMSYFLAVLAEVHASSGSNAEALDAVHRFQPFLQAGNHFGEIEILRAQGICARREGASDWERFFHQAIAVSKAGGVRPEQAICHCRFAECLIEAGEHVRALEELELASALFRELNMSWWLEKSQTLLRLNTGRLT